VVNSSAPPLDPAGGLPSGTSPLICPPGQIPSYATDRKNSTTNKKLQIIYFRTSLQCATRRFQLFRSPDLYFVLVWHSRAVVSLAIPSYAATAVPWPYRVNIRRADVGSVFLACSDDESTADRQNYKLSAISLPSLPPSTVNYLSPLIKTTQIQIQFSFLRALAMTLSWVVAKRRMTSYWSQHVLDLTWSQMRWRHKHNAVQDCLSIEEHPRIRDWLSKA